MAEVFQYSHEGGFLILVNLLNGGCTAGGGVVLISIPVLVGVMGGVGGSAACDVAV